MWYDVFDTYHIRQSEAAESGPPAEGIISQAVSG